MVNFSLQSPVWSIHFMYITTDFVLQDFQIYGSSALLLPRYSWQDAEAPLGMSVLWLADPGRGCETDREEEQFLHFSPICIAHSVWAGGLEPAAAEEMSFATQKDTPQTIS